MFKLTLQCSRVKRALKKSLPYNSLPLAITSRTLFDNIVCVGSN